MSIRKPMSKSKLSLAGSVGAKLEQGDISGVSDYVESAKTEGRVFPNPDGDNLHSDLDVLKPEYCFATPFNRRSQALLSLSDPDVKEIYDDIAKDKQYEPVMARNFRPEIHTKTVEILKYKNPQLLERILGDLEKGIQWHEIGYGTTRRFCVHQFNEIEKANARLKAWVADFSDEMMALYANKENKLRREESILDEAEYYSDLYHSQYGGEEQKAAAMKIGLSEAKFSKLIAIHKLPLEIKRLVKLKKNFSLTAGHALASIIVGKVEQSAINDFVDRHPDGFEDAAALLLAFKQFLTPKKKRTAKASGLQYSNNSSGVSMTVKNKKGGAAIEFKGMDSQLLNETVQKIADELKLNMK